MVEYHCVCVSNGIIIVRRIEMWRDKMPFLFSYVPKFNIENNLAIKWKAEKIAQIYFLQPELNMTSDS